MLFCRFNKQSVYFPLLVIALSSLTWLQCNPNDSTRNTDFNVFSPEINANDIHSHIKFLASDSLQGRESGTEFEAISANYIIQAFEQ